MFEIQKNKFEEYFKSFDTENENIARKYYHSLRVMEYSIEIAKSLNLPEKMVEITGISGLLHDIGRFEQWKRYGTYSDISSIDHAELGVEILKSNNYIKEYVLDNEYIDIIYKAVREHNKYKISDNLSSNEEIVCKIIRDADKIDILETQNNNEVNHDIILHKEILENIYKKQCCINSKWGNKAEMIIKQICFIYDLNFQYSFNYIINKNIIYKKFKYIKYNFPKDININEIEREVYGYLDGKISSSIGENDGCN